MEQRRNTRFRIDQPVWITIYGQPDIHLKATIKNLSGRGIGLEVNRPLAIGSALKVVLEDAILLGEVIYCRDQGETWYAGVELEHALCGLAELAAALRGFSDEPSVAQEQHAVEHTGQQYKQ